MNRITRAWRRMVAERAARHWHNEVLHLLEVQESLGPALDNAFRRRDAARLTLILLEVDNRCRPPTYATGRIDNVTPLPQRRRQDER